MRALVYFLNDICKDVYQVDHSAVAKYFCDWVKCGKQANMADVTELEKAVVNTTANAFLLDCEAEGIDTDKFATGDKAKGTGGLIEHFQSTYTGVLQEQNRQNMSSYNMVPDDDSQTKINKVKAEIMIKKQAVKDAGKGDTTGDDAQYIVKEAQTDVAKMCSEMMSDAALDRQQNALWKQAYMLVNKAEDDLTLKWFQDRTKIEGIYLAMHTVDAFNADANHSLYLQCTSAFAWNILIEFNQSIVDNLGEDEFLIPFTDCDNARASPKTDMAVDDSWPISEDDSVMCRPPKETKHTVQASDTGGIEEAEEEQEEEDNTEEEYLRDSCREERDALIPVLQAWLNITIPKGCAQMDILREQRGKQLSDDEQQLANRVRHKLDHDNMFMRAAFLRFAAVESACDALPVATPGDDPHVDLKAQIRSFFCNYDILVSDLAKPVAGTAPSTPAQLDDNMSMDVDGGEMQLSPHVPQVHNITSNVLINSCEDDDVMCRPPKKAKHNNCTVQASDMGIEKQEAETTPANATKRKLSEKILKAWWALYQCHIAKKIPAAPAKFSASDLLRAALQAEKPLLTVTFFLEWVPDGQHSAVLNAKDPVAEIMKCSKQLGRDLPNLAKYCECIDRQGEKKTIRFSIKADHPLVANMKLQTEKYSDPSRGYLN